MALEREIATFDANSATLANSPGKFALVQGDDLHGTWDTYADAIQVGYLLFGLQPFMVKRIEPSIGTLSPLLKAIIQSPPPAGRFFHGETADAV